MKKGKSLLLNDKKSLLFIWPLSYFLSLSLTLGHKGEVGFKRWLDNCNKRNWTLLYLVNQKALKIDQKKPSDMRNEWLGSSKKKSDTTHERWPNKSQYHMRFGFWKFYLTSILLSKMSISPDTDYDHLNPTEMAHPFKSDLLLSPLSNWSKPKLCRYRTIHEKVKNLQKK